MLTIAGGLFIAGAIGLLFSWGSSLLTASDRYSARWAQRLFGTVIVISTLATAFGSSSSALASYPWLS